MNTVASASFSNEVTLREGLILEQSPWESDIGVVTKETIVSNIASHFGFRNIGTPVDCGLNEDGSYTSTLVAFPYDADLVYDIGLSYGSLGSAPIVALKVVSELLTFNNQQSASLTYPFHGEVALSWKQGPWNKLGENVQTTPLSYSGNEVTTTSRVYGSVLVSYYTVTHTYTLIVPPRDSEENKYQSVAWARWDGGYTYEVLEPPENAEESMATGTTCRTRAKIDTGDPFDPPTADGSDTTYLIDYCSFERMT